MRVLGVLAVWSVLAVLATLCFAVGGSIGYRRGVEDAIRQFRERRGHNAGCGILPLSRHHQRRPMNRSRLAGPRSVSAGRPAHTGWEGTAVVVGTARQGLARALWAPIVAAVLVAVFVVGVPGAAIGATTAQPGESLWNLKRRMEHVRLAVAIGPDSTMRVHVDLASRRIGDLNHLMSGDVADPDVVETVITDLRGHIEAASRQLSLVETADRPSLMAGVDDVVARQVAFIDVLMDIECTTGVSDPKCVALDDTRAASVALANETTTVALQPSAAGADGADTGGDALAVPDISIAAAVSEAAPVEPSAAPDQPSVAVGDASPADTVEAPAVTPPDGGDTSDAPPPPDDANGSDAEQPATAAPSPSASSTPPPPDTGGGGAAAAAATELQSAAEAVTDAAAP